MSDEQGPGVGGETIGVYRVEKKLGRGGMGEVYLAYDERLDRRVAVKRIRHQKEAGARQRERFRREARAAAKLSHPAIAQVYDVVLSDAGDSIVMEYVPGRTLGQLLAAGELDAPGALRAAVQVAEGLAAAHGKGFVHRDLKKENVMVTPEGQAKILDFGLAKELHRDDDSESLTERGALLGTVTSMSPEQAAGLPVDARSDLFSFGVLLYEIFTGRSPFRRDNPLQTLQSVVHENPPPPRVLRPELPHELSALIEALLEKDSARRPASAAEVAAALRRIAGSPGSEGLAIPSAGSSGESWMTAPSDAPTGSRVTSWHGLRRAPASDLDTAGRPTSTVLETPAPADRRRWLAAGLAVVALALVLAFFLPPGDTVPELRVVVLEPQTSTSEAGDEIDLTAFAVLEASLGTLAALDGVDAVKPSKVSGGTPTAPEAARQVAADEALEIRVECRPSWCWVSFHRLRGSDGVTLSVGERFEVPRRPEDSLDLTRAVRRYMPDLYPHHPPRSATPRPDFRPEDYGRFLALRKKNEAGEILGEEDLEELAAILKSSPRFLAGHLLAAGVARFLGHHGRALELVDAARKLAPRDPRPLFQQFQVELEMGEVERAAATLGELERLAPGNLRVSRSRADLLAAQGRLGQAVAVARGIVDRQPSWRNVLVLAEFEQRVGEIDRAAERLAALRAIYPENVLILGQLAGLESRRGELETAVELYRQMAAIRPRFTYLHNLGWNLFLLGSYDQAVDAFRRALEIGAGDFETRFNLAAALQAAGREDEALELCREILRQQERDETRRRDIIEAQCLVRLDRAAEAVEIANRVVRESEDPEVIYQAAEVFTLAGDRISALYHLAKALENGLSPRWLGNPSFRALEEDAEFQRLLRPSAVP